MNFPSETVFQVVHPFPTTVSSPKLDLVSQTWNHIAERYIRRLEPNRIHAGRVRSIRLLAVHDAIHSVIDPGNGYIFHEISAASGTSAAAAAAIRASHDLLASVFTSAQDREDLADLLKESLSLLGGDTEIPAGIASGARAAAAYHQAFAPLLTHRPAHADRGFRENFRDREFAGWWRRSA